MPEEMGEGMKKGRGMPQMDKRKIFVINNGSTSIKVAVFEEEECVLKESIPVDKELTSKSLRAVDQLPFRMAAVEKFIDDNDIDLSSFSMISSRGGPLPPCRCGAYAVNDWMIDVLTYAPTTLHVSALSCMIGDKLAKKYAVPHIIYDSVLAVDMDEIATYTGLPGVSVASGGHVLNTRAVSKVAAEKLGKPLEECSFIVAHMGGGCTFSAVKGGRMNDYHNDYRGCITPERCGTLPLDEFTRLCYSGKYSEAEMQRLVMGGSGFLAYTGTSDGRELEARADNGDSVAALMFELMAYGAAKQIGQMGPVLKGKIDAIILTGGLANNKRLINLLTERISYMAPIEIIPGELEMEGLAKGALAVLDGKEEAQLFDLMPRGFSSKREFYEKFKPEVIA